MKISCNWLGKYISLPNDVDTLISTLTFSGIEVEAVQQMSALPESVRTARIVSSELIHGSDHLHVCQVDDASGSTIQVVCGAPNCRAGMISVLAGVGSTFNGIAINKAKLRGVESYGMLCSEKELGISDNHTGIIELPSDTPLGMPVNKVYELPDTILELEITPNRPDLLGYIGIARDLSASLGVPMTLPETREIKAASDSAMNLDLRLEDPKKCPRYTARLMQHLTIQESPIWLKTALIKSGLRPVNNVVDVTNYIMLETGNPLHAFDYDKLQAAKPEDGFPAIVIRAAHPAESFVALDGKDYRLDEQDLVIADGQSVSALAGVMGGKTTSITDSTTRIVLETANFEHGTIRATSYKHKISTDSSYRFERQLSPEMLPEISARAVELILSTAGGEVVGPLFDAYPKPEQARYLGVRPDRFKKLIGVELDEDKIKSYLIALGCEYIKSGKWVEGPIQDLNLISPVNSISLNNTGPIASKTDKALYFRIPSNRVDLLREVDLLEELARLAGYDTIPQKTAVSQIMDRHAFRIRRSIEDYFVSNGFHEVLNYSFCDPSQLEAMAFDPEDNQRKLINLKNPQSSNQAAMRISLIPQLLGNISFNLNHGERNLKLMETAKVYHRDGNSSKEPLRLTAMMTGRIWPEHWKNKMGNVGFSHVKGLVEGLMHSLGVGSIRFDDYKQPWLTGTANLSFSSDNLLCGYLGSINPLTAEAADIDLLTLKQELWVIELDLDNLVELTRNKHFEFSALPRFPGVTRDISFLISKDIPYNIIEQSIRSVDIKLVHNVAVFDEYRGKQVPDDKRSVSLRIFIQDMEKTLTDERVDKLIASVLQMLEQTWHITMR